MNILLFIPMGNIWKKWNTLPTDTSICWNIGIVTPASFFSLMKISKLQLTLFMSYFDILIKFYFVQFYSWKTTSEFAEVMQVWLS